MKSSKSVTEADVEEVERSNHARFEAEEQSAIEEKPKTWIDNAAEAALRREAVPLSQIKRKKVVPLNKWVVIRKYKNPDKLTDGGMVLTETETKSSVGEVMAVSKEVERDGDISVGDLVVYTAFPIEIEDIQAFTHDKELQLVRYEEIYGRVVDAD
jgi:co-chaperonin GroES (HSP10)